jgi:hypothetical protein
MAMAAQPAVIIPIRPAIKLGDVCCKLRRPLGSLGAAFSLVPHQ